MLLDNFPTRREFALQAQDANVIPVGARILADSETPVSLLARFAEQNDIFLLESAEGGERWGRYSFMGLGAHANITIYRDDVVVRRGIGEKRLPHHGEPLAILRDILKPYRLAPNSGLPRFCGGLVGYFAYEMVSFFEPRIKNTLPAEKPMAEFVIPKSLLIFDNIAHTLAVVSLAFLEGTDPARFDESFHQARESVAELLAEIHKPFATEYPRNRTNIEIPTATQPPEFYLDMVKKIKEKIKANEVIQCVVSQSFVGAAPDNLHALYRAQRYINPSPYLFFLKARGCTLIGSSPETMIRLDGRTACLRPIAGTRTRRATEQEDRQAANELLQDEKERSEHLMLVDLGRSELGRVAQPGTIQVTDLMIVERYSHVMHLVSNITAEVEDKFDAFDLFKSTFPAGTLSGAPKVRAMELIAELEDSPRGPYGGAVGYFSFDGNMDFCICIRTAVIEHGRLEVRTGAGIVNDSNPQAELDETINKAAAMARSLQLLQNTQVKESGKL